jgi:putative phage-type endonuclease
MSSSGHSKVDEPPQVLVHTYKSMFRPVTEMLGWTDMNSPAPSYAPSFEGWRDDAEHTLQGMLSDPDASLSKKEEEASEVASQIGLGILERFVQMAGASGWTSQPASVRRAEVERILALPQVPQRTQEWYVQGKQVLTASEFANIFGSPRAVRQLAFQKVVPPADALSQQTNRLACRTCEMGPFDWGVRFEPVVKGILYDKWKATIADSGRLMHPTDPLLAASPDGLILDAADPQRIGRLLEIKCPITREIGNEIPFEYWCQMQIQMEVTGIDECEYVEVKIESNTRQGDLSGCAVPDGYVWLFQNTVDCKMSYAYDEAAKDACLAAGLDLIETIPWRLKGMHAKTVVRDRGWFQSTATAREEFWLIVDQARRGEIQPFEVKSRAKASINVIKEGVCLIKDDSDGGITPTVVAQ